MSEGYTLLATGNLKYVELAISCAQSLRYFDPNRPRQIFVSPNGQDIARDALVFDYIDVILEQDQLPATLNKLRLTENIRFDANLFIDADCLLMKSTIDHFWRKFMNYDFTIPGKAVSSGIWYETELRNLCTRVNIPYIVRMNSGVIFYRNNEVGRSVFLTARDIYMHHSDQIVQRHAGGHHGDEPFIGMAMGATGQKPLPETDDVGASLMFSTIGGTEFDFDIRLESGRFRKGDVPVDPHIVHFVGLRPQNEYADLRQQFQELIHT